MSKKLGLLAAFIIVACLSFFITKGLKDSNNNENTAESITPTESYETTDNDVVVSNEIKKTEELPNTPVNDTEDVNKIVLKASKPVMAEDSTYSFRASFTGKITESYHFELRNYDDKGKVIQSSNDGKFANIPPVEKGRYRLYLVNEETGKNIVPPITVNKFVFATKSDTKTVAESDTKSDAESAPEKVKKTVKFKPIKLICKNNKYSFKASTVPALTESHHYELLNDGKMIKRSDDGAFDDIPPVEGACYTLRLISEGEELESIEVKGFKDTQKRLITKEEFQKRMLDYGDHTLDGSKRKTTVVDKNFKVILVNTNIDFDVSDVQDVRDMIKTYNKWKSARVVELEYDAQGYVTCAKVEPVL